MAKITHYAKIKEGKGQNYYLGKYHLTSKDFKGVPGHIAKYLIENDNIEVITQNQYNKLNGVEEEPKGKGKQDEKE